MDWLYVEREHELNLVFDLISEILLGIRALEAPTSSNGFFNLYSLIFVISINYLSNFIVSLFILYFFQSQTSYLKSEFSSDDQTGFYKLCHLEKSQISWTVTGVYNICIFSKCFKYLQI